MNQINGPLNAKFARKNDPNIGAKIQIDAMQRDKEEDTSESIWGERLIY